MRKLFQLHHQRKSLHHAENQTFLSIAHHLALENFPNHYYHYRSKKIEEINLCPETNFLFYEKKIKTQLRITTVSKIHYKDKLSKNAWEKSKLSSRKCYLTNASPSSLAKTPTDGLPKHLLGIDPNKDESEKGYNNFSVIDNQIKTIDWLYLSSSGHRRLSITIDNIKNDYQWLIP